jgi:hypothetical protein
VIIKVITTKGALEKYGPYQRVGEIYRNIRGLSLYIDECIQSVYNIWMPVILRLGRLKFYVYPHDHRPAHVHIVGPGAEAKFEIETGNCLRSNGYSKKAINKLSKKVVEHSDELLKAWRENEGEE